MCAGEKKWVDKISVLIFSVPASYLFFHFLTQFLREHTRDFIPEASLKSPIRRPGSAMTISSLARWKREQLLAYSLSYGCRKWNDLVDRKVLWLSLTQTELVTMTRAPIARFAAVSLVCDSLENESFAVLFIWFTFCDLLLNLAWADGSGASNYFKHILLLFPKALVSGSLKCRSKFTYSKSI